MASKKQPPDIRSPEYLEELRKYGKKAADKLFKQDGKDDFDENELASGSADLIEKSDSELFPDEIEEYTEKEKKPRIVVHNKPKKP